MLVAAWLEKNKGYVVEETIRTVKKIVDDRELTDEEISFISNLTK